MVRQVPVRSHRPGSQNPAAFVVGGPSGAGKSSDPLPQPPSRLQKGRIGWTDRPYGGQAHTDAVLPMSAWCSHSTFFRPPILQNCTCPDALARHVKEKPERSLKYLRCAHSPIRPPKSQRSGGQQPRVNRARAVHNAQDLLFDEPTRAGPRMAGVLDTISSWPILHDDAFLRRMGFARSLPDRVNFMAYSHRRAVPPPAQFFAIPQPDNTRIFLARS